MGGDPGQRLSPRERYQQVIDALAVQPGVTVPRQVRDIGRSPIKVDGEIFAMFTVGNLMVRLPEQRTAELLAAGHGTVYDPRGDGGEYQQWLTFGADDEVDWVSLAAEALDFVRSIAGQGGKRSFWR